MDVAKEIMKLNECIDAVKNRGRELGRAEVIRNILQNGKSVEEVQVMTGLSLKKIREIEELPDALLEPDGIEHLTYTINVKNEGIRQGHAEVIGVLLRSGIVAEEIHTLTGLQEEEIQAVEESFTAEKRQE
jgi:hypothetical protein